LQVARAQVPYGIILQGKNWDSEGTRMLSRIVRAVRQNVVAWLALFVALTGTSIAATHYVVTSTKQIKPSVLRALRAASGKEGPAGNEGPAGKTGLRGETGPEGKQGLPGTPAEPGKEGKEGPEGPPGSARAYAHVSAAGTIEAANAKAIEETNVAVHTGKAGEPIYCFSGLSFPVHNVQVTVDANALESEEPLFATATLHRSRFAEKEKLCEGADLTVEVWQLINPSAKAGERFKTVSAPFFVTIN
jgi:Collagen triple helix repeat (20 copies)